MFIDEVIVTFAAWKWWDWIVSWRREKYIPKWWPWGWDGWDGWNVILVASDNLNTLGDFRNKKVIKAQTWERWWTQDLHGKNWEDVIIKVPVGTVITDAFSWELIYDLSKKWESIVLCKWWKWWFWNSHFISSTRQAPNFAEQWDVWEEKTVKLELKLVADIWLVWFPNAGKSTLIKTLTNVKPKIAPYPFTTLIPNLWVMEHKWRNLVIEDVPGLIEWASDGKGLGVTFLKHIERTRIILHLLDCNELDKIVDNYKSIRKELEKFSKELAQKEEIIILTKTDLLDKEMLDYLIKEISKKLKWKKIFTISAAWYIWIPELKDFLVENFSTEKEIETKTDTKKSVKIYDLKNTDSPKDYKIVDNWDLTFRVTGERIEQIVRMTDYRYPEGIMRVYDVMEKMWILTKINSLVERKYKDQISKFYFEDEESEEGQNTTPKVLIGTQVFDLDKVMFM